MPAFRNEKIRKTLMKEISDIIQKKLNDSRIGGVVSIIDLEVAHDNSYAKVYYSVFAPDDVKQKAVEAIEEDAPKIRYEVGRRIRLRLTPELKFILNDSLERGARVTDLINKISKGEIK